MPGSVRLGVTLDWTRGSPHRPIADRPFCSVLAALLGAREVVLVDAVLNGGDPRQGPQVGPGLGFVEGLVAVSQTVILDA